MSRYDDPEGMGPVQSPTPGRLRLGLLGSHPIWAAAAIIATVLVVGVSLVAYAAVRNVYDGINHEAVTAQMLGNRPPKLNGSTNILLIGSDSRAGTRAGKAVGFPKFKSRHKTAPAFRLRPGTRRAMRPPFAPPGRARCGSRNSVTSASTSTPVASRRCSPAVGFTPTRHRSGLSEAGGSSRSRGSPRSCTTSDAPRPDGTHTRSGLTSA